MILLHLDTKFWVFRHANITANTCQYTSLENAFIDPNVDRMIGVLPLFHIFGLTAILHTALYWGIPVYILPRFDLVKFCETVQDSKITFACLVPPIILLLAKHEIVSNYDLSSLRITISGAAPLSADLSKAFRARLPNLTIKQGYGLTETSPTCMTSPTDRTIDGSTGILLPNMLAKIVDENGNGKK
jgi:acyl-CoA synthetase (AMP-forming)/AMP-acid ligase II